MGKAAKAKKKRIEESSYVEKDPDASQYNFRSIGLQTERPTIVDKLRDELQAQKQTNSKITDELERLGTENCQLTEQLTKATAKVSAVTTAAKTKMREFRQKAKAAKLQSEQVCIAMERAQEDVNEFKEMVAIVNAYTEKKASEEATTECSESDPPQKATRNQEVQVPPLERKSFFSRCRMKLRTLRSLNGKSEAGDKNETEAVQKEIQRRSDINRDLARAKELAVRMQHDNQGEHDQLMKTLDTLIDEYRHIYNDVKSTAKRLDEKEWENLCLKADMCTQEIRLKRLKITKQLGSQFPRRKNRKSEEEVLENGTE